MNAIKRGLLSCLVIAFLFTSTVVDASEKEKPTATAIIIDIPIRVIGMGTIVLGTGFAVIATPFALFGEDGALSRIWGTLVMDPLRFTFTRPVGQFEDWKKEDMKEIKELKEEPKDSDVEKEATKESKESKES
ncbi:hypothetical protein WDW89_24345 [Deltaproteobacteria bacterium TL4]